MALDARVAGSVLDQELAGLDALETGGPPRRGSTNRLWSVTWPKMLAAGLAVLAWQAVVWSHHWADYLLPGPATVFPELGHQLSQGLFWKAAAITLERAVVGFSLAVVIGTAVGAAVARVRVLRSAVGALITGLQTMPSVVWFPLALLLLKLSDGAIVLVVVLGAAPSIANGIISGMDHVPPLLLRSGRVLGARGLSLFRHVMLPAALPSFVGGLKQGWAFAWRSLMAGELLVVVPGQPSLGSRLEFAQQFSEVPTVIALMIVILVIGILADACFSAADRAIRKRWGLIE